ncbi:winged helix DNA-binding domain-containing protein [Cryobacterium sp. TMT1-3]|uniref:Winged helix DNA-binding domain-containing protein n=1 Tax=Cryobacterium luteum TaxID=1424661 RepID=A0A1H8LMB3_9MICO|nr:MULTISPECIES: winged helix DNA-binding domain-containing protein [Cryobacterium]TFB83250.1 winged helix DNA-binding domain-containing protein [Cryobacterium luteum]TFC31262.1 winged helix DNA-binding domain-containing protein [Cryobacterium sp. TMT1-3]SEO06301.1 Winged helix DNA-binding domain-containing protein [Cryobacterium luteum]
MPAAVSRADVVRLRLHAQGLAGVPLDGPVAVVERMLAVQAQDYPAAQWALGVRSPGTTIAEVQASVSAGEIVRSWPMRGTLHFVPARELGWMQALTTPRLLAKTRTINARLGLDLPVLERARAAAIAALTGHKQLSRAEFLTMLQAAGLPTEGQRGYHTIAHLALTGTVCWGRQVGTQQGLVLLDEWVPTPRRLERDEALGEFVYRYFLGHGPATLVDFAWWSQLTVADAKTGLAVARGRLTEVRVDGAAYFLAAESADAAVLPTDLRQHTPVLALPGFDEYLLGYRDRSHAIAVDELVRVVPGLNGIFLPLVVASGRIVGTWRKKIATSGLTAEVALFAAPTTAAARARAAKTQRGFARAASDYARFLGVPLRPILKPAVTASA